VLTKTGAALLENTGAVLLALGTEVFWTTFAVVLEETGFSVLVTGGLTN
jgi:hypothetical protein